MIQIERLAGVASDSYVSQRTARSAPVPFRVGAGAQVGNAALLHPAHEASLGKELLPIGKVPAVGGMAGGDQGVTIGTKGRRGHAELQHGGEPEMQIFGAPDLVLVADGIKEVGQPVQLHIRVDQVAVGGNRRERAADRWTARVYGAEGVVLAVPASGETQRVARAQARRPAVVRIEPAQLVLVVIVLVAQLIARVGAQGIRDGKPAGVADIERIKGPVDLQAAIVSVAVVGPAQIVDPAATPYGWILPFEIGGTPIDGAAVAGEQRLAVSEKIVVLNFQRAGIGAAAA